MKQKLLLSLLGMLIGLPLGARDFTYEYEGQTIIYTVLDEEERTVETKKGTPIPMADKAGNPLSGDVIIPETAFDSNSFYKCEGLSDVDLPALDPPAMSSTAFEDASYFDLYVPEIQDVPSDKVLINGLYYILDGENRTATLTYEYYQSLDNYSSLEVIDIPVEVEYKGTVFTVTEIGEMALNRVRANTINLPESLRTIGGESLACMTEVKILTVPQGVELILDNAFMYSNLKVLIFSNSVEQLSYGTCACMSKIKYIELGSGLETIGGECFNFTYSLETLICKAAVPPVCEEGRNVTFTDECYENTVLYVPEESIEAYRNHPVWGGFRNIKPIDASTPTPDDYGDDDDDDDDDNEGIAAWSGPMYIIGEFNDWTLSDPSCLMSRTAPGVFEWNGTVLTGGFKFNDGSWNNDFIPGTDIMLNIGSADMLVVPGVPTPVWATGSSMNLFVDSELSVLKNPHVVLNLIDMTVTVTAEEMEQISVTIAYENGPVVRHMPVSGGSSSYVVEAPEEWGIAWATVNGVSVNVAEGQVQMVFSVDGSKNTLIEIGLDYLGELPVVDMETGTIELPQSNIRFSIEDGSLKISGCEGGENVTVYTSGAQILLNFRADSDSFKISLASGVYIVKVKDSVVKVIL